MMGRPFKIWSADRKVRKCLMAESLKDLITKGSDKLALSGTVTAVLECDGTEVDDEEYFACLPDETCFLLLSEGQEWSRHHHTDKPEDEADAAYSAPADLHSLLDQLRYNMTVLVTLSNQQLQMIIEADTALIASALSDTHVSAATLQDTCQRYLDDRSMAVEAMDLLRMYNKAKDTHTGAKRARHT